MNNIAYNKNISWINTMKAICLIGVYFVHCQLYYGLMLDINSFIYPFYVNGFFFISGYLLFWKQLSIPKIAEDRRTFISEGGGGRMLLSNILYRMIIPSILFSFITFLPSCIIQGRDISISFALYKTIGGGTYWFTSALVISEIILLVLFWSRNKSMFFYGIISLLITIIGLMVVRMNFSITNMWAWRQGLIALFFLFLGGVFWKCERFDKKIKRAYMLIVLLILYIVLIIGFKELNNPLISTLEIESLGFCTSSIACILLAWICKCLPDIQIFGYIGRNSLGFYFLSGALPIIFSKLANSFIQDKSIFILLLVFLSSIIIAYTLVYIMNKWFPWLFDLRLLKKKNN